MSKARPAWEERVITDAKHVIDVLAPLIIGEMEDCLANTKTTFDELFAIHTKLRDKYMLIWTTLGSLIYVQTDAIAHGDGERGQLIQELSCVLSQTQAAFTTDISDYVAKRGKIGQNSDDRQLVEHHYHTRFVCTIRVMLLCTRQLVHAVTVNLPALLKDTTTSGRGIHS